MSRRRPRYPAVAYSIGVCEICSNIMSFQQMRQAVYWLPDMDKWEYGYGQYNGFTHKWAHRTCWDDLKEKRREYIRLFSFKNQEPRSMGQRV